MRRISRGPPAATTTGLLLTACIGLATVIYFELDEPPLSGVAQSRPAGAAVAEATAPAAERPPEIGFDMPPLAVFSEITARPLFSPTRRPPPPPEEAPAAEEAPVERGQFALRGVALAGDRRVALLQRRATGELVRALEGQSVDGWRVAGITATEAVLESGGDKYVVEVEKDVSAPVPVAEPDDARGRRRAAARLRAEQLRLDPNAAGGQPGQSDEVDPDAEEFIEEEPLDPNAGGGG
ncbi:MAG TPA: hypothetical protein VFG47_05715 [Geminicoccaceae bacterium]|nr:hypothetical protein [Geminicoccaceae bacterium]